MEKRIFLSLLAVGAISVLLTVAVSMTAFYRFTDLQIRERLAECASLIAAALDEDSDEAKLGGAVDYRMTIVEPDGSMSYDSAADAHTLPNHLDRPEIAAALEYGSDCEKRGSDTFGEALYYYALRLDDGRVLRLAAFDSRLTSVLIMAGVLTVILAAALISAAAIVSKRLTFRIVEPVRALAADITLADSGDPAPAENDERVYPEFRPLVDKIRRQQLEIKHQLTRVEKERNRLSAIINNMDEGLIVLDNNLRVIMLNDSACQLLRSPIPRAECAGLTAGEIIADERVVDCLARADSMRLNLDGRCLQLHVNHVVAGSEQVGLIGLILDITERTEIDRIKQEFTANVSHELKTPLTSISGYAELIENGMAAGEDAKQFAGRIRRESARLLSLISDIIKLSQLDEAADGDSFEPVELYSVCRDCVDVLSMSAKRSDVKLILEGEPCELMGSASELSELAYNLIDNAIRYNRPGGEVKVKLTLNPENTGGAAAALIVADTGIGIPEEHIGRVFERFYRVDKSRSKATGGTGLGLAIVKHIAERHGAKLELDSKPGVGTTVKVIFYDTVSENL